LLIEPPLLIFVIAKEHLQTEDYQWTRLKTILLMFNHFFIALLISQIELFFYFWT